MCVEGDIKCLLIFQHCKCYVCTNAVNTDSIPLRVAVSQRLPAMLPRKILTNSKVTTQFASVSRTPGKVSLWDVDFKPIDECNSEVEAFDMGCLAKQFHSSSS